MHSCVVHLFSLDNSMTTSRSTCTGRARARCEVPFLRYSGPPISSLHSRLVTSVSQCLHFCVQLDHTNPSAEASSRPYKLRSGFSRTMKGIVAPFFYFDTFPGSLN